MTCERVLQKQAKSRQPLTPVANGYPQRGAIQPSPVHEVPPIVHEVLRSPAQALDANTRAFMGWRFGHDFSHVVVYGGLWP